MSLLFSWQPASGQTNYSIPGSVPVGSSTPAVLPITFRQSGTLSTLVPLTSGNSGGDFALSAGGTCAVGQAYTAGAACTATVLFTPRYPGLRIGAVVAKDSNGVVLGTALVSGQGKGGLPMFSPGTAQTFAGVHDAWFYAGDGVPAVGAPINLPSGVVLDFAGNLYLADTLNNRIRRADAGTGLISTVAGTGLPGFSGDGGPATAAAINSPAGLALDGAGNLFVADQRNHVVRRIDAATQVITTVAGTGQVRGYAGDGGLATAALLNLPLGISFDAQGNLLIADTYNHAVRMVDAATGLIRTLAGTGSQGFNGDGQPASTAQLSIPALALARPDGTVLIADTGNNRVRRIDTAGLISTLAGNGAGQFAGDGGPATSAGLKNPTGLAADPAGNIYIADSSNNRVRMVAADTGGISTVMGTDSGSFSGDGGPANIASLYNPNALFFAQDGTLYISDSYNQSIRGIVTDLLKLTYSTIRRGKVSQPKLVTLANRGNDALTLSSFVFNMSAVDSTTTSCNQTAPLLSLQTCQLGVQFAPTIIGQDVVGTLDLPSSATSITPEIRLDGEVLDVNPTTATVVSSKNPSVIGNSVTFTATVTSDDTGRTGNVTITSDGTPVCTSQLQPNGTIVCTTSSLTLGSHTIVAQYAGDAQNAAATSATLTQVVKQSTTLQLSSSSNPATVTASVTFTVVASAATGTPTGTVTFLDGAATLGTAVLANGQATLSTSSLAPGTHSITVQYPGDANDAAALSSVLPQQIQQAGTTTLLAASSSSPPVGTSVTFTASVSSSNGPAPTGSVQFKDGSTVLGTVSLGTAGSASFSTSSLAPGNHSIVAVYSGDGNDAGSTSTALAFIVQQLGTTTAAQAASNPLSAGATEHLTANVGISNGSTPQGAITGTVVFSEGATTYDTVTLSTAQSAATDVRNLPVGTHVITVAYSGNTNYASSSTTITVTVNQTAASVSLSDANSTTLAGGMASFTAAVSSGTGIPTGTVVFRDGSTTLGSGTLDAHGVATFSTASLVVGGHTITAVYGGDANYTAATSAAIAHTVNRAIPTLTLSGSASTTVNVTANVSFSLTLSHPGATPTGTISLRDGSTVIATLPVTASGTASFSTASLGLGQHSISAGYSGDDYNESASSPTIVLTVQKAPTATALVSSTNPATLGAAVALTATVTAPTPNLSGTVNFLDGQQVIGSAALLNGSATLTTSQLSFGHHPLSAAYVGSDIHAASSSAALDQNVRQQAVLGIGSSLNPSNSGQAVTFTVSAQPVGGLLPTGTVTFTDNGTALGTGRLDSNGHATLQTSSLPVGVHTIAASFGGDDSFSSAQVSLVQTVKNSASTTVETVSANPATYGAPLTLTATVTTNGGSATGQVLFAENGAVLGSGVLGGTGVATFTTASLSPGRHTVVASYQTDGQASGSTSAPVTFLVQQQTSLAVSFDNNPTLTLTPVVVTATLANSNAAPAIGTVQFFDGSSSLGSAPLANGVATLTVPILSAGTHAVTATYAGDDANYAANAPVVNEVVKLRATTTSLTSSATNTADTQQVTLIAIVQSPTLAANGVPTGSITFAQAGQVIGTAPINAAGLATLNQELEVGAKESVTAAYSGDANYATSSSASTNVQSGPPVNFTIATDLSNVQLSSGQHQMLTVTLTSLKGFNDSIRLGCVGLPYAATCTFTKTSVSLAANGTETVQLMVDTGDPLGQGGTAMASNRRIGMPVAPVVCLLPGVLLLLYRRRGLLPVLAAVLLSATLLGSSGCSGLRMSSTPAGTYAFQVTGVGTGTGAKQTQTLTLVVAQ